MKIKILGSSGGESYPAMFCGCDHCNEARRVGGKSIRTLSQTLINNDLLIDLPADTAAHARAYGLNLGDIPYILITHVHHDHFQPAVFCDRGFVYAHDLKAQELTLYGSEDIVGVYNGIDAIYHINPTIKQNITLDCFTPFETKTVGSYRITALPAKHATQNPLNYVIEDGEHTLLYLHDTGYPNEDVLAFLSDRGVLADAVMMDATMGVMEIDDSRGHMSFDQNKRLKPDLIARGIATESTVFVSNHITHNKAETHEKVEQIFENTGILVAYDGMEIKL